MNKGQLTEQELQQEAQMRAQSYNDNEIDLSELFSKIWKTRVAVFKAVSAITLLFIIYLGFSYINAISHTSYSRLIKFTFDGVEKSEYPNGTQFKLADIIAPTILHSVYKKNSLERFNITESGFSNSVTIEPYSQNYELILKKYEALTDKKKMKVDEISELRKKRAAELESALVNSAKISIAFSDGSEVPVTLINKLLLDIPRIWADMAINQRGVMDLDISIYSSRIFDEERITQLDYLIGFDLIDDNINLVLENVDKLLTLPNGLTVVDTETGFKLNDLKKAINDVRDYDINELSTPVTSLGIAKNKEVVSTYYKYRIKELERQYKLKNTEAEIAKRTLIDYRNAGSFSNQSETAAPDNTVSVNPGNIMLDGSFLNSVIDLSKESADMPFRQEIIRSSMEGLTKAASLSSEIEKLKSLVSILDDEISDEEKLIRASIYKELKIKLPNILNTLRNYVDVTNRLYAKLSKNNLGNSGALYKNIDSKVKVVRGSFYKKSLLIFIMTLILVVAVTVFVSLARQGRQLRQ